MNTLHNTIALVTGASRGVGAAVARMLAEHGADVVVNYRSKAARAEAVAAAIRVAGRRALLAQADVTQPDEVAAMADAVRATFGRLDLLVLNASGGLEKDKAADYAMLLNRDAQVGLVEQCLPLMPPGSRIVFVTSHMAHFHGEKPGHAGYEPVAISKKAGEEALRSRIPMLAERGISLVIVSGDVIEGTITPRLLERLEPGLLQARRAQAGALPTVAEFAAAIVRVAADAAMQSGDTLYVGAVE